jgi:hypothetical protein
VDNSFPRISLSKDRSRLGLFAQLGEYSFLSQEISKLFGDNFVIIPVSRTVYELTALVLHATDRINTPFAPLDNATSEMTFIEPFSFDHKTTVHRVTSELLLARTDQALAKESLMKAAFNINWILLACVLQMGSNSPNPLPIHSIMDLELDLTSFTASRGSISSWIDGLKTETFQKMASIFLADLSSCARGQPTDLSRRYDTWPLTSPYLASVMPDLDLESSTAKPKLAALETDLFTLSSILLQSSLESHAEATKKLEHIRQQCMEDLEGIYGKLCSAFCPELLEVDEIPKIFSGMKRFVALLDIYRRADPFISAIRNPGFFSESHIIMEVIQEEMRPNETNDLFFAFRGSMDMSHESLTTLEHSISQQQYGMELGSSSNYQECHSNPCKAHSMSFGSSLFAGMLYDPTASVWTYWASKKIKCGYMVQIPIDLHLLERMNQDFLSSSSTTDASLDWTNDAGLNTLRAEERLETELLPVSDWFFIPPLSSLLGLAGSGELWHARTKCSIGIEYRSHAFSFITGMLNCSYRRVPDFLMLAAQPPNINEFTILTLISRSEV